MSFKHWWQRLRYAGAHRQADARFWGHASQIENPWGVIQSIEMQTETPINGYDLYSANISSDAVTEEIVCDRILDMDMDMDMDITDPRDLSNRLINTALEVLHQATHKLAGMGYDDPLYDVWWQITRDCDSIIADQRANIRFFEQYHLRYVEHQPEQEMLPIATTPVHQPAEPIEYIYPACRHRPDSTLEQITPCIQCQ